MPSQGKGFAQEAGILLEEEPAEVSGAVGAITDDVLLNADSNEKFCLKEMCATTRIN